MLYKGIHLIKILYKDQNSLNGIKLISDYKIKSCDLLRHKRRIPKRGKFILDFDNLYSDLLKLIRVQQSRNIIKRTRTIYIKPARIFLSIYKWTERDNSHIKLFALCTNFVHYYFTKIYKLYICHQFTFTKFVIITLSYLLLNKIRILFITFNLVLALFCM